MIFNRNGGGAGLNFKVIAYASEETLLAATPAENTIGVITTTGISSWIFSATEPENPANGMVWFPIGTASPVEFNALKKNGIQVYPLSPNQYVSGAWVDVTAKSYQGGEWVNWYPYGYLFSSQYGLNPAYSLVLSTQSTYDSITVNEKSIDFAAQSTSSYVGIGIAEEVDLRNFSTLKCRLYRDPSKANNTAVAYTTKLGVKAEVLEDGDTIGANWIASAYSIALNEITISVDISSVSNGYIMVIGIMSGTFYDLWLE